MFVSVPEVGANWHFYEIRVGHVTKCDRKAQTKRELFANKLPLLRNDWLISFLHLEK